MSSENEVSILIRVLKLICSSSSCGNAFKTFLYLKLQMAIDIFGMKSVHVRKVTIYAYRAILFYHNKRTVVITNMRPLRSSVMN